VVVGAIVRMVSLRVFEVECMGVCGTVVKALICGGIHLVKIFIEKHIRASRPIGWGRIAEVDGGLHDVTSGRTAACTQTGKAVMLLAEVVSHLV